MRRGCKKICHQCLVPVSCESLVSAFDQAKSAASAAALAATAGACFSGMEIE